MAVLLAQRSLHFFGEGALELSLDSDPVGVEATDFEERWISVSDGVDLRLLHWNPTQPATANPVLFVAGWISVLDGWIDLLRRLIPSRPVYYLETREKRSARIPPNRMKTRHFSLSRLAQDLIETWRQLELSDGEAELFGSSMGANAILEALKYDRLPARAAFLIGPNSEFLFPWWSWAVLGLPTVSYPLLRRFVLWYLRNFRVDAESEPEQMRRYVRTLNAAHPLRLKRSALAVKSYQVWPGIDTVEARVGIGFASSDKLHSEDSILKIVDALPNGHAIRCESNTYMHTAAVAEVIDAFFSS
jgi:pimeloyl-ACP methyl ester carboxylesterase